MRKFQGPTTNYNVLYLAEGRGSKDRYISNFRYKTSLHFLLLRIVIFTFHDRQIRSSSQFESIR